MDYVWDTKADVVEKGDKLRKVVPIPEKTYKDKNGYIHYVFSKIMFKNPWYTIPDDDFELFDRLLHGGSRMYPSDGSIPCDIVARETRLILNRIVEISKDPTHIYYEDARQALKNGKKALVRGTMKIYLEKYTTRDWRRKRFTDDIDFWCFHVHLLDYVLKELGWKRNQKTGEWEKTVSWHNPYTGERKELTLYAANNLNQLLDFGAGSYLEGSGLKEIFSKKLKRGHDVDISDIINIALNKDQINPKEWARALKAVEEAANSRNTRTTSNLISISRYALTIADYLERVGAAVKIHHHLVFDKKLYPNDQIEIFCYNSIHWMKYFKENGPDATRKMLHEFLMEQTDLKPKQAENLREFAHQILSYLNSKYEHLKIIFEIED
ncbi:MAG: hypothetical protein ACTSPW_05900 [Promethearchaeota archaeon]